MNPNEIEELFYKWFNEEKKSFPPMPEMQAKAMEVFAKHAFAQGMLEAMKNLAEKFGIKLN